ncbi:hypothetical protein DFH07DRAFT_1062214 [Mycena maculata]|uniref:Uncharacterized protein n=1 Tax=Mycena maculata TaxID=230809 RepID=A0AAD7IVJ6_9AGAR|nr:hypothetical protein DFH07DRAFT_1062214 [Mycena maculata]
MLAGRLIRPRLLAHLRPPIPCALCLHWRIARHSGPLHTLQSRSILQLKIRTYSDDANSRIADEGLPLHNSGPTTAALLAYAEAQWASPSVIPPGWSTDWRNWDYLLTFFAFSPYFLRLPQIEMLVNIKYAVQGEVRPLMYSPTRDALVFQIDLSDGPGVGGEGAAEIFLLDCRAMTLWTYDADQATNTPDTIDELVLLIGAAPTPEGVPMMQLEPDPEGEAALKRVLARDASVIPLLEDEFLGYAPRVTKEEEELANVDEEDKARKTKLAEAITRARGYVAQAEEELRLEGRDLRALRAEQESGSEENIKAEIRQDMTALAEMREAVDEAKAKLAEMEETWVARYGEWDATK